MVRRVLLTEGPLVLGWERSLTFDNPYCSRRRAVMGRSLSDLIDTLFEG